MTALTPEQKKRALDALNTYLQAPPDPNGHTPIEQEIDTDQRRVDAIEDTLKPLVAHFLGESLPLADFKTQIDRTNKLKKTKNVWGFTGFKGLMFFNMLQKAAADGEELESQIRVAIREPTDGEGAAKQLRGFASYVELIGQQFVEAGGKRAARPKEGSVPFFVSYFWQIQRRDVWPVYYTTTVQAATSLNLWHETGEVGDDYLAYKQLHEHLVELFSTFAKKPLGLYDVEHVFYFYRLLSAPPSMTVPPIAIPEKPATVGAATGLKPSSEGLPKPFALLPDSYVPPIVDIIPRLALNDPELQEAAVHSGTKLDRAFEKSVNAAFTVMGYETKFMGQGSGRVPDGVAIAAEDSYAVIWDAKARTDGYTMGTDDRVIRKYIDDQIKSLKKRGIKNFYYLIVSSSFTGEFKHAIQELMMTTGIKSVCLIEATALVALVNQKLRRLQEISLGSDGIQRIFSSSRIINASYVLEKIDELT